MHVAKVEQAMFVDQLRAYNSLPFVFLRAYNSLPFVFANTMRSNSLQSKQWDRASEAASTSHRLDWIPLLHLARANG